MTAKAPFRVRWQLVLPAAALAAFAFLVFYTAWLGDDAYITFRTIDNWRHGYGLRWNVAERVQAYTHPLWLFVLSGAWSLTGEPYFSSLGISIVCSLGAAAVVALRVASSRVVGALAVGLLAVSRAFVDYSTSGLENPLSHLLLALFVAAYWGADRRPRRVGAIVALGMLAAMNRLDLGLLLAPALLHVAVAAPRKAWSWIVVAALPLVAWEIFSIVYYGFPFPNTAYAKLPPNIRTLEFVPQGVTYLVDSWRSDPVTLATIAFALLLTLATASTIERATMAAGLVVYLAYVLRVGGDFMSGRFLAAPFLVAVGILARHAPSPRRSPLVVAPVLLVLLGCVTGMRAMVSLPSLPDGQWFIRPTGIADERYCYTRYTRLVSALQRGAAPIPGLEQSGREFRRLRRSPVVADIVGMTGYGAGPDVFIIDRMGLGDALLARLPALRPWRVGHFMRAIPDGYAETAATGHVVIADPALARYYSQLALITRGPIWSRERWKAILAVNLGRP